MTEVSFYHLQAEPLERALPRLLEKVLERQFRTLIRGVTREKLAALDENLWTFKPVSFLPHAVEGEGEYPAGQPILLSASGENPNGANVLVLIEDAPADDLASYDRCLYMFDGNDDAALALARARWKTFRDQGLSVSYYQQTETGWQKKA